MEEIYKDIEGYEGLYQVSNLGNVRSLDRIVNCKNEGKRIQKGRVLDAWVGSHGYYSVGLSKNGMVKTHLVHRLVAEAFIPNPDNLPYINHRDENKLNNTISNIEWCTPKYNIEYSHVLKKSNEITSKPVLQFTKDGKFVAEFDSASEAARAIGVTKSFVCSVCRGRKKIARGFVFKYKEKSDV